jgi:hypothetical protein
MDEVILTKKRFEKLVEEKVSKYRISYMDAVIMVCEERTIDPIEVGKFITPAIKDKVEAEAIGLNMMKGGNTLPL